MNFLESQIKLHEGIIQVNTTQLNFLKELQKHQSVELDEPVKSVELDEPVKSVELDEPVDNDLSSQHYLANTDMLDHDQDLIWDRIRMAHPERYVGTTSTNNDEKLKKTYKENNLVISDVKLMTNDLSRSPNDPLVGDNDPLVGDNDPIIKKTQIEMDLRKPDDFIPLVTRLSQFTQKKQGQIIKNIFLKAKENIEHIAELDKNISDNIDAEIQKEADRLLSAYLDNK
jgi:hypothetical protein